MTGSLHERIERFLVGLLYGDTDQDDSGFGPSRRGPVPDVRGLEVDDAFSVLARDGFRGEVLRLEERPAPVMGTVVDQAPEAGTRRRRGSRVVIHVLHPRDPRA